MSSVAEKQLPFETYTFDLAGLDSAPQIEEVEKDLRALEGVRTRIVFPHRTAWVSAPVEISAAQIVAVFEAHGITARLTESSAARLEGGRVPRRPRSSRRRRHAAGRINRPTFRRLDEVPTDVLFTSRDLVTLPRLVVALVLGVPVIALSAVPQWQFAGWQYVALVVALPVVLWSAWPFHRALVGGVRRGLAALDGASAIAILASYVWSVGMLLLSPAGEIGWTFTPRWFAHTHGGLDDGTLFFDVACGITILLLIGRRLTMRTRVTLLERIDKQLPEPNDEFQVARRGKEPEILPLQEVNVGDDVHVAEGELIPVDGRVIGGACRLAPNPVTGSNDATHVHVGDMVFSGSRNISGEVKVRVLRTGHATRMAAIRRWVEDSTASLNRATLLSTRTAALLIPTAVTLAVLDFFVWWLATGNANAAFSTAVAILASVAPVALALSTSLALRHGIESGARHGIMLRGNTMRRLTKIDSLVFDRQGTLTGDTMTVQSVVAAEGEDEELVLRVAGALVIDSEGPASQVIVRAARSSRDRHLTVPHYLEATRVEAREGEYYAGQVDLPRVDEEGEIHLTNVEATVWRPQQMSDVVPGVLTRAVLSGGIPYVVSWKGQDRGVIVVDDTIAPEAPEAVSELHSLGVTTVLVSRDVYPVVRRFADRLGIDYVLAGLPAEEHPRAIRSARARGATVAFVGDERALATLPAADVGVLMGPTETLSRAQRHQDHGVDAVLLRDNVRSVPQMLRHARRVCRVIDQNLLVAWGYNIAAVVLSAAGVLHPLAATVLMLGSSVLIEARSHRVRKF